MSRMLLALLVVGLAFGCTQKVLTQWPQRQIFSAFFRLQEVRLGMSQEEVEGIMGSPQMREEGDFRGGHFVLYFYRTHNMDYEESGTVRGGFTPLVFQNNRLVGRGNRDYLRAVDRSWGDSIAPPASPPTQTIFPRRSW